MNLDSGHSVFRSLQYGKTQRRHELDQNIQLVRNSNVRGLFFFPVVLGFPIVDKMAAILFHLPMVRTLYGKYIPAVCAHIYPDHWKTELLASQDCFKYKESFLCLCIKQSRLAKSSVFQWSGPLENNKMAAIMFLENRTYKRLVFQCSSPYCIKFRGFDTGRS